MTILHLTTDDITDGKQTSCSSNTLCILHTNAFLEQRVKQNALYMRFDWGHTMHAGRVVRGVRTYQAYRQRRVVLRVGRRSRTFPFLIFGYVSLRIGTERGRHGHFPPLPLRWSLRLKETRRCVPALLACRFWWFFMLQTQIFQTKSIRKGQLFEEDTQVCSYTFVEDQQRNQPFCET